MSGILYRVETLEGQISYLFGTMHVGDERALTLPVEVIQAFTQAKRYAFEKAADPTLEEKLALTEMLEGWKKRNNGGVLSDADFLRLYPFIEPLKPATMSNDTYKLFMRHRPPMHLILMAEFGLVARHFKDVLAPGNFLDALLLNKATLSKKPITHLESLAFQLGLTNGLEFSFAEQMLYFNEAIALFETREDEMLKKSKAMGEAYILGTEITDEPETFKPANFDKARAIVERFRQALMDERNEKMSLAMWPLLQEGNVFVAMGAAHLPGIISLLKARGCTVTAVDLSERLHSIKTYDFFAADADEEAKASEPINPEERGSSYRL